MRIEWLNQFLTLAKYESMNKAAEALYISQQQLSRNISSLEELLHCKLFTRTNKGIQLTATGKEFIIFAKKLVEDYNHMLLHFHTKDDVLLESSKNIQGTCKLLFPPILSIYLSDITNALSQIAPALKLKFYEQSTDIYEYYPYKDAICFWGKGNIDTDNLKFNYISIGTCQNYYAYSKTEPSINTMPSINVSTADWKDNDTFSIISSNIYQLLEIVKNTSLVAPIPDYAIPKIYNSYPEISYKYTHSLDLYIVYPSEYTLTKADEMIINFLVAYIKKLQATAEQLLQQ